MAVAGELDFAGADAMAEDVAEAGAVVTEACVVLELQLPRLGVASA